MATIDYKLTHKYFYPDAGCIGCGCGFLLGNVAFVSLIIFACCVYNIHHKAFLKESIFHLILSIIIMAFPFFAFKNYITTKQKEKKVTLADILGEIEKVKQEIPSIAAKKLGVKLEDCNATEPIILQFTETTDSRIETIINTDDNFPSTHRLVVLLFSDSQVFCYRYVFSLLRDEFYDSMDEYFFKDIVSFQLEDKNDFLEFAIVTNGGTSFTANIYKEDEEKVQKMRQLLREKKQS